MQNNKLSFYFDFVSPYSFFAWEGLNCVLMKSI